VTRNGDDPDKRLAIFAGPSAVASSDVAHTHVFGFDAGVLLPTSILQGSRNRLPSSDVRADTMLTDHERKEANQHDDACGCANPLPDRQ